MVFAKLSADNGISIKRGMKQKDEVQEKPSSNTCKFYKYIQMRITIKRQFGDTMGFTKTQEAFVDAYIKFRT